MKIYGDVLSGNCLKVRYACDYLGQCYEWIQIDAGTGRTRDADFLALNPHAQLPVLLLNDGRALRESNAILRYLAYGTSLLPVDRVAQAEVDAWLFWEQYSHEPYVAVCRFQMKYLGKPASEREPWRVERAEAALDALEAALGETDWLAAGQFSIADIALLAYTRLAPEGGFELGSRPAVSAWITRVETRLGIPAFTPDA